MTSPDVIISPLIDLSDKSISDLVSQDISPVLKRTLEVHLRTRGQLVSRFQSSVPEAVSKFTSYLDQGDR